MCAALQKGYANDGREDKRHFTKKDIRVHHRDFRFYTIKSVLYVRVDFNRFMCKL